MKKIYWILLLLFFSFSSAEAQSGRIIYTINNHWKFLGEGVAFGQHPDFVDDSGWETVNIPHTWNAQDPFDDKPSYKRGIGWYRKRIRLSDNMKDKRIYLHFEGANQVADVYVNGAFAGEHKGGYTAFTVDVTDLVDLKKEEQLIAVSVNNAHNPFIPPLSVGYALYGGIYRDVWLMATNKIHFDLSDHGSKGVFISTPEVSNRSALVKVAGTIANENNTQKKIKVISSITDEKGNTIEHLSKAYTVGSNEKIAFSQDAKVNNPHLWSPDNPYIYTVNTQIKFDGKVIDEVENPLGLRWFSVDPDSGFYLNGKPLNLKGTNRHQDYKGKGSALSNEIHRSDMKFIKNMGANFIRLAHYPQDPAVLKAADELGLLVWEEIPVVNYINTSKEFYHNAENMLKEMIHQHYNHPSIVMWGSMNEVFLWGPKGARIKRQDNPEYAEKVRRFATSMDSVIHKESPDRFSAMAMHMSSDYEKFGIEPIPKIAGFNVYDGWYGGTFDGFGKSMEKKHKKFPDQNNFISEYGAGSDQRLNSANPKRFDFTGQYQRRYHESYLRQAKNNGNIIGMAIWNEFDFSQPHTGGSVPHINQKGMATWDRKPKDVYYLYKANWNPDPMIHIATDDWEKRAAIDGKSSFNIDVYSNLESITLYVNQKKVSTKTPDEIQKASWDVTFTDGKNTIKCVGKTSDGRTIEDFESINVKQYHFGNNFKNLAVNVGSNAQYTDGTGLPWIQDQKYKNFYGYSDGTPTKVDRHYVIRGSDHDAMYYTYLDNIKKYRVNASKGRYKVTLFFLEPEKVKPGDRVFDVDINGEKVIDDLDLMKQAGFSQGVQKTFIIQSNSPEIEINFQPESGKPVLNGLKIRKID